MQYDYFDIKFWVIDKGGFGMNAVAKVRKKRAALAEMETNLINEERGAIKRAVLTCIHCGKKAPLGLWTFIQKRWYVRPVSCTEGDYWRNNETQLCDIVCPHCKRTNYIYAHPQRKKIVDLVGKETWRCKDLFKEVVVKTSR